LIVEPVIIGCSIVAGVVAYIFLKRFVNEMDKEDQKLIDREMRPYDEIFTSY
jgi:hypothetical protein